MDYDKLISLAGSDESLVSEIKAFKTSNEELTESYNKLEKTSQGYKTDLDKYKQGNTLVKTQLGLEQLNEETLTEALGKLKGAKGDDKLQLEIENLNTQLKTQANGFTEKENALVSQIRELKNGSVLSDLIAKSDAIPDAGARNDLAMIIKSQMSYDDSNNVVFLNEDGTTRFNSASKPFGMEDAIKEALDQRPYLRNPSVKGGSGAKGSDGEPDGQIKGSKQERTDAIKQKYNL